MAKSHSEYQGHGVQFAVPGARNSGGRGWRCVARGGVLKCGYAGSDGGQGSGSLGRVGSMSLGRGVNPNPNPGPFTQAVEHKAGQGSVKPGPGCFYPGSWAGQFTLALELLPRLWSMSLGRGELTQALDVFTQAVEHEPGQGRVNPGPGCFYPGWQFTLALELLPRLWSMSLGRGELTQALDVFTQAPGQGSVGQGPGAFTQAVEREPGQGRINPGPGAFIQAVEREPGLGRNDPGPGALTQALDIFLPRVGSMSLGRGVWVRALELSPRLWSVSLGRGVLTQALELLFRLWSVSLGCGELTQAPICFNQDREHKAGLGRINPGPGCFYPGCGA
ncbi:hypothetical protein Q8A73_023858 [Channa argus]|nr:hypothetical protein Q8A73_023858 [Channa argus]